MSDGRNRTREQRAADVRSDGEPSFDGMRLSRSPRLVRRVAAWAVERFSDDRR